MKSIPTTIVEVVDCVVESLKEGYVDTLISSNI